jgi:hypothetical protein
MEPVELPSVYLSLCTTAVTQTLCCSLYCAKCCGETVGLVLFTELTLNAFCPNTNNATYKWRSVQLAVDVVTVVGTGKGSGRCK